MGTASDEDVEFLKNKISQKKQKEASNDELIDKINKKKQKSSNYSDAAVDFVRGFESGSTYGYAPDILSSIPGEGTADEIKEKIQSSKERSPTAFEIGDIAGFAVSPATKAISFAGKSVPYIGSKIASLLKSSDAIKKSKYLSSLAKTLGFAGEYVAPGAAMSAAQEGDQSNEEIAISGAANAAISKYPYVAGGALIGSKIADMATDDTKWNKAANIVGPIAGAVALKGGKTAIDLKNAAVDPAVLKAPLELLEKAYLEKGRKTPSEMRGTKRQYKINDLENQSDFVRDLRSKVDELRIMLMKDVPVDTKTAYKNIMSDIGDLKYDTISDILEDSSKHQKLISSLDRMNKDMGFTEEAAYTLNKMISSAHEQLYGLKDDPLNLTIDDIIVAKVRQTPIRHLRAFNNVFSETRKMKDFDPDSVPLDVDKLYAQSLQAERDVDTGRLNKWLRDNSSSTDENINYSRLFDPYKPWRLLTDEESRAMSDQGRKIVFGKESKIAEKNTGKTEKINTNEQGKPRKKITNKAIDEFMSNEEFPPELAQYRKAIQDLYDMREGQRQIDIERHRPGALPGWTENIIERFSPVKFSDLKKLSETMPSEKISKYDKSKKYYANLYGMGKHIENMPAELRPQILRVKELAKRNDSIGDVFKAIDNQIESGNISNALKALYYVETDEDLRKYLQ